MAAVFLLGFFFDWIEITLIVLPVFGPIVGKLDFGPMFATVGDQTLWFAMLVAMREEIQHIFGIRGSFQSSDSS